MREIMTVLGLRTREKRCREDRHADKMIGIEPPEESGPAELPDPVSAPELQPTGAPTAGH